MFADVAGMFQATQMRGEIVGVGRRGNVDG